MAIPISRHSLMYFTTLSWFPRSLVRSAAMKYCGCCGLQIRRAVCQHGIRCRMRFIEAVTGKLLHQIEYARDLLLVFKPLGTGPADEFLTLGGHFLRLLLAHGAPQQIRLAK